jgi:glyoxylase-like metal-dependent hydrolase (beta-lactamase superfamily II)
VELVFPGRGHTSGDLVVRVPDVDVMLAGDLVEESAKPWIGLDSYVFDWPGTLDLVVAMATTETRIVPGHGIVVDRAFVDDQRDELVAIAETVRMLAGSGVPVDRAVAEGTWPWESDERIANAVTRGYEALPPSSRSLPLA